MCGARAAVFYGHVTQEQALAGNPLEGMAFLNTDNVMSGHIVAQVLIVQRKLMNTCQ